RLGGRVRGTSRNPGHPFRRRPAAYRLLPLLPRRAPQPRADRRSVQYPPRRRPTPQRGHPGHRSGNQTRLNHPWSRTMNYQQPTQLQAAILDWAGTVVDFGSFAPTQIFVEAFAEFGVQVSLEEARGPMGMGKWDHIRTLCNVPEIAERY